MQLTGKITKILPLQSGQGKKGEWKKQDFVIETNGEYPKKVCFTAWGDKTNHIPNIGTGVTVSFDPESREYNGKYYTDLKAWKIESDGNIAVTPPPVQVPDDMDSVSDDLPF